jgi:NADH-quinone oxidoreductase subunit E
MDSVKTAPVDMKLLADILAPIENPDSSDLIPILQKIQAAYGYLPPEVLMELSDRAGIAASQIYGVVTFYEQFYLEPHGRHTIRCCRGTACHVKGGKGMIKTVSRALDIEPGQTTEDMQFTFETVACLGACALAPVMVIDGIYYGKMTQRKAKNILNSYKQNSEELV